MANKKLKGTDFFIYTDNDPAHLMYINYKVRNIQILPMVKNVKIYYLYLTDNQLL